jgi:hypothetical protein
MASRSGSKAVSLPHFGHLIVIIFVEQLVLTIVLYSRILVYQQLVAPHLADYDIVLLPDVITLAEHSPDECSHEHHQKQHGRRK